MKKERDRADPLARLVKDQSSDLVILAECTLPDGQIIDAFGGQGLAFTGVEPSHPKVTLFRRTASPALVSVNADDRVQFFRTEARGFEEILIGAAHLPDRRNHPTARERYITAMRHVNTMLEAESIVGHSRTLFVGDFNMTPDEIGMVDPERSFGALMTWDLARAQSPRDHRKPSRFFNPMWSIMGRAEAPGTYYWDSKKNHNIHWLCIDGVIARHSLRGVFLDETLKILTKIPGPTNRELPLSRPARKHWKVEFSDHLPIAFELELRPAQARGTS